MTLLFRILRAAHARGTHHKLALDALQHLKGAEAESWRRLFLEHAALYMEGSKAPDNEFKDFKNHVLHVRDGYWGGAPDKVVSWYGNLVEALRGERWSEAVWAAGVLSHYYTDPIHPFHTGQTEAENNVHRAVEWSINRSYDALKSQGDAEFSKLSATPGNGPDWLRAFVIDGAEASNRYYEKLIAHYDINKGVVDPPAGLDVVGRRLIAELLRYASTGYAAVLQRAFADAEVKPPAVNLTVDTVLATLQIPIKLLLKRIDDKAESRLIQNMYDELKSTGRVERYLPEDDRAVRDLFSREVQPEHEIRRLRERAGVLARPAGTVTQAPPSIIPGRRPPAPAGAGSAVVSPAPQMAGLAGLSAARLEQPKAAVKHAAATATAVPVIAEPAAVAAKATSVPSVIDGAVLRPIGSGANGERAARVHLAMADDVERAPSIGPKTAERLYQVGIRTVADLLAADPAALAPDLDVRHIKPAVVESWQDQCRLVMSVPGLRGAHAQLLVGAGYRDAERLAHADRDDLMSAVLAFATSADGQRVLREGQPPDMERIVGWIEAAAAVKAA